MFFLLYGIAMMVPAIFNHGGNTGAIFLMLAGLGVLIATWGGLTLRDNHGRVKQPRDP